MKAILFDIDGVLIDSLDANLKFFQEILSRGGYKKPSKRAYRKTFHLTLLDTLRHFAKPELEEELERLQESVEHVPYPFELLTEPAGIKETLEELAKRYHLALVSSRRRRGIEMYLGYAAPLSHLFTVRIGFEDTPMHKPHPEPLLLAAARLRCAPKECVYVGDAQTDIEAGKKAGMKTILFGRKRDTGADARTASFRKIPALVESFDAGHPITR